jgi:hypothetical protein
MKNDRWQDDLAIRDDAGRFSDAINRRDPEVPVTSSRRIEATPASSDEANVARARMEAAR